MKIDWKMVIVSGSILGSCASTFKLNNAPTVPAAEGMVTTKMGDNQNTKVKVVVEHLAPPQKINDATSFFTVWVKDDAGSTFQNLGQLRVDKNLKGTLETVTPLKTFELTVTPEASPTATAPTNAAVLTAHINTK